MRKRDGATYKFFKMKYVVCNISGKRNVCVSFLSMSRRHPKCIVPIIYWCAVDSE